MKLQRCLAMVPFFLATAAPSTAAEIGSLPACAGMSLQERHGVRLAIRAQEGEFAFMRYVQFKRPMLQWSTEEAVRRARAAAASPCGRSLGLKPVDARLLPELLAEEASAEAVRTAGRHSP